MPRVSGRKLVLRELENLILAEELTAFDAFDPLDDSSEETVLEEFLDIRQIHQIISTFRYFDPRVDVPKSQHFFHAVLPILDGERFRQEIGVSKEALDKISLLISKNLLFENLNCLRCLENINS